ncbi:hypothetical protein [Accumulibacter sp.]|uniref:hypothetical protein n=1 Tax=Candidatus Accumulibacter TaxID=327159 RepID=UPI0006749639|nr:hypothetical protein [Accumulibacter sp.]MBN8497102.1 hypothetical protein [Accumulibacter sp.]
MRFSQFATGRNELHILVELHQRLAAQQLGLLALLGEAAAEVDRQFDERSEFLGQRSDGCLNRHDGVGRKGRGYERLARSGICW